MRLKHGEDSVFRKFLASGKLSLGGQNRSSEMPYDSCLKCSMQTEKN